MERVNRVCLEGLVITGFGLEYFLYMKSGKFTAVVNEYLNPVCDFVNGILPTNISPLTFQYPVLLGFAVSIGFIAKDMLYSRD